MFAAVHRFWKWVFTNRSSTTKRIVHQKIRGILKSPTVVVFDRAHWYLTKHKSCIDWKPGFQTKFTVHESRRLEFNFHYAPYSVFHSRSHFHKVHCDFDVSDFKLALFTLIYRQTSERVFRFLTVLLEIYCLSEIQSKIFAYTLIMTTFSASRYIHASAHLTLIHFSYWTFVFSDS